MILSVRNISSKRQERWQGMDLQLGEAGSLSSCRGRSLENYIIGCFEEDATAYPNSIEFGVTQTPIQMTSTRALTTRRSERQRYPREGKTYKKPNQSRNTNVDLIPKKFKTNSRQMCSSITEAAFEVIKLYEMWISAKFWDLSIHTGVHLSALKWSRINCFRFITMLNINWSWEQNRYYTFV